MSYIERRMRNNHSLSYIKYHVKPHPYILINEVWFLNVCNDLGWTKNPYFYIRTYTFHATHWGYWFPINVIQEVRSDANGVCQLYICTSWMSKSLVVVVKNFRCWQVQLNQPINEIYLLVWSGGCVCMIQDYIW